MSPINKTLAFVMCAVCSVGAAAITHYSFKPVRPDAAVDIGEPFFPEFDDPSKATSLRVAAHNEKTSKTDVFQVEFKDGQWRIPSHHNYPADGKDHLAKTAASMIGITRGTLVSSSDSALKTYGVLDPLDKDIVGTEGRGNRITLSAGDTVLADYIIGKKEGDGGDRFYVRAANENRVYLSEVKVELSTKFVDWIQPNLLEAASGNFRELILDRYEVDEAKGTINQGEVSKLTKKTSADPWKLEGLDEAKFKIKDSVVNAMTRALGDLKIVGVRPKPAGLGASLKGEEGAALSPLDQIDMQQKGYFLTRDGGLLSNEGEFIAGLADGVVYKLRFGEVFTGSEVDIEIGSPAKPADDAAKKDAGADKKADASAEVAKDEKKPADEKDPADEDEKKENRYVFITVQLDEKLLGEAPVEPVKPTPPEGYKPTKPADAAAKPAADETPKAPAAEAPKAEATPAAPDSKAEPSTSSLDEANQTLSLAGPPADAPTGEKSTEDAPKEKAEAPKEESKAAEVAPGADAPAENAPPADQPAATPPAGDKPPETPAPPKDPNSEYEEALKKYEQELDEYRVKKQDYEEKVKKGNEQVKKLNDRFADWYYVISSDLYKDLKVAPDQLFEPKEPPKTPAAGTSSPAETSATPPADVTPAVIPDSEPATTPDAAKPEESAEKKADEGAKSETGDGEAAKPDEPKADAPKEDAAPKADSPPPNP